MKKTKLSLSSIENLKDNFEIFTREQLKKINGGVSGTDDELECKVDSDCGTMSFCSKGMCIPIH